MKGQGHSVESNTFLPFKNDNTESKINKNVHILVLCGLGNKALLKEKERFSVFVSNPERRRTD